MNMTHFSLSELPETQQESGSTLSSQTDIKCQSSEVLFNTLQETSLGPVPVCPGVLKKVLISMVIWLPCPVGKMNQKGRKELRGGILVTHRKWLLSLKGRGSITKPNIPNHRSLRPFSAGKTVPHVLAASKVYKTGGTKETLYLVCSLIYISNNSTQKNGQSKKSFTA